LAAAPSRPGGCPIIDIRMPEMGGLQLQQHLIDRALELPLIVITRRGDVPLAVRAMKPALSISSRSHSLPKQLSAAWWRHSRGCRRGVTKTRRKPRRPRSWGCSRHVRFRFCGVPSPAAQQIDRLRSENQPGHRRHPPGAADGQDGGAQPLRADPFRPGRRPATKRAAMP